MANPYAIKVDSGDGVEVLRGEMTFTDPGNQPGSTIFLPRLQAACRQGDAFHFSPEFDVQFPAEPVGHSGQYQQTVTGLPVTVSAGGIAVDGLGVTVTSLPDSADAFDLGATLTVTDLGGTQVATLAGGVSIPAHTDHGSIDWSTANFAAVTGADLSWDNVALAVKSAAGGIFVASLVVSATYD